MSADNGKVCGNCKHYVSKSDYVSAKDHCDIDGQYIGYIDFFEHWCRHWAKSDKWEGLHEKA